MVLEAAERLANSRRNAWLLQIGSAASAALLAILLTVLAGREPETPAPLFAQQFQPQPHFGPATAALPVKADIALKPAHRSARKTAAARLTRLTRAHRQAGN
jgi:hypothetical protein